MRPKRVLVTDGEERSVLAACRGLQSRGYEVTVTAGERLAVSHWSRSCARRVLTPCPSVDAAGFVDALVRTLSAGEHDVLIPGTDAALLAVSGSRARLEPRVRIGLPPDPVVRRSVDKRMLADASRAAGLDTPVTFPCESVDEGISAAEALGFPVVVKPLRSVAAVSGSLQTRGSKVVADRSTLRRAVGRAGIPYLVQRLERQGSTCSFAGVIAHGRLLAYVFSRYLRTWPPAGGAASFSETITPRTELVKRIQRMVESVGWLGIFELEGVLESNGRFTVIDFNPRLYGSLALALAAGVNLPAVWCDWLLGRRPTTVTARSGVFYKREDAELGHLARALRRNTIRSAAAILRPRRSVAHAYFRTTDPLPLAAQAVVLGRRYTRQRGGQS
jgi:predicted ATP-grasp superfamily ATP-dependent carboligase